MNLYMNKEIVIRPEYQRLFRWSHSQKVKLIESILLGIPVPSIFVYQDQSGIWELVDGLQRVSSILQFFGVLEGEEPLELEGTKYIPTLEGIKWINEENPQMQLPPNLQLTFKRAKLNLTIILNESDDRAKFEVFQRLNTGGSNASNQEVRNNVMIMIDPEKYEWFNSMAENDDFLTCLSLSERLIEEQYQMELLLRYIALNHFEYNKKKDVGDFLDDINDMLLNDQTIDFVQIKNQFEFTFSALNRILAEKAFKKFKGDDFKGKFLESAFEAISVGLSTNFDGYDLPNDDGMIYDKIRALYSEDGYNSTSGSGSSAKSRIPKLIPFAREYFQK